jgi:hypothetical protein
MFELGVLQNFFDHFLHGNPISFNPFQLEIHIKHSQGDYKFFGKKKSNTTFYIIIIAKASFPSRHLFVFYEKKTYNMLT